MAQGNRQLIIIIITALILVLLAVGGTMFMMQPDNAISQLIQGPSKQVKPRQNVFAGYDNCVAAIEADSSGKIISLYSVDRSARFDPERNVNKMMFNFNRQDKSFFFSESESTTAYVAICNTDPYSNKVKSLSIAKEGEMLGE